MQNEGRTSILWEFLGNKWVKLILIIDVIIIVGVIGVVIWNSTKTATINFNIAPVDAKIQIDGSGEYMNGAYQIHPGTHSVTITRDGLTPKTLSVDTQSGYVTTLTTFLSSDDFSFYKLKDNYTSFLKLAEIASSENNITTDHDTSAEQFISDFQQNYHLYRTALPIEYYTYEEIEDPSPQFKTTNYIVIKANTDDKCDKTICLKAQTIISDNKELVNKILREKGFNLDLCEVKYE